MIIEKVFVQNDSDDPFVRQKFAVTFDDPLLSGEVCTLQVQSIIWGRANRVDFGPRDLIPALLPALHMFYRSKLGATWHPRFEQDVLLLRAADSLRRTLNTILHHAWRKE